MSKEIYLAGGCFWGTQLYLDSINGIVETDVGYANGNTKNPTYEEVCNEDTGHSEAVRVVYDPEKASLPFVLELYYSVVNPTAINSQGGDVGSQYRTGVYYTDHEDKEVILKSIEELQKKYDEPIAIEVKPLENYYLAEEYHQKYMEKNPTATCHIPMTEVEKAKEAVDTKNK